jgi:endoglucanase
MTTQDRIHVIIAPFALSAALLLTLASRAPAAENPFHRGIGISQVMNWATVEPGDQRVYAYPPFPDPSSMLTSRELGALRGAGFDFLRLAVDPGPFLQFQGARRDALDRVLRDRVNQILAAGLSVIVDFHPSDANPDYTATALTRGVDTAVFQSYLRLLARTAGWLDAFHSGRVALELMNEPPVSAQSWQPMLDAAYAAIRARAKDLLIVLDGGDEASAAALRAVRTDALAKDANALFTFHYYDPYQFTHQGAPWNAAKYLTDVPYPALARPLDDSLSATTATIAASDLSPSDRIAAEADALRRLESYRLSGFDRGDIARTFDSVAVWAQSHAVPAERVLLGEFGARKTSLQAAGGRAAERAQWFRDVREAAQAHGFGWAVWTYRDSGGFDLARSDASDELDPAITAALGLPAAARQFGLRAAGTDYP